jgi:hypothetical protein
MFGVTVKKSKIMVVFELTLKTKQRALLCTDEQTINPSLR